MSGAATESHLPPIDTWGQVGHLTPDQQECLNQFIVRASPADLMKAEFKLESTQSVSLRFLRARQFNVTKALALLQECILKKKDWKVHEIIVKTVSHKKSKIVESAFATNFTYHIPS